ncbi:MAG: class IV adenylate cyclase [Pirellulales bacterium]
MTIEVEQKYAVGDRVQLVRRLAALTPSAARSDVQVDCYYSHPSRDFAHTDEALRLRRVGDSNYITYKGPKLDATTKSRREIEIQLPSGTAAVSQTGELLTALGFTPVAQVTKRRDNSTVRWQGRDVAVALDSVDSLGDFVELEILVPDDELAAARECLLALAEHLQLTHAERRSYLELLLELPRRAI